MFYANFANMAFQKIPTPHLTREPFNTYYETEVISLDFVLTDSTYCKIGSSNTSRLEEHVGFFKLLMKGIFDPCVL